MNTPALRRVLHLGLLVGIAIAITAVSYQFRFTSDWTRIGKHSLTQASIEILSNLAHPIRIRAYLPRAHPARRPVADFIERYRRHHTQMAFEFIDPATEPQEVRDNDIKDGEIIIEYQGRSERVSKLQETVFSSALARLARNETRFVVFVSGHGERSPTRGANHDVSTWAEALSSRGLNVQEINLTELQSIPDNTSVLVIASPQLAYLPGEIKLVARYLANGGNLLWLSDPEEPQALQQLATVLGVDKVPGTIVDPASLANGLDNPALLLASKYGAHGALERFNLTTLFVYANAYVPRKDSSFSSTALVRSGTGAWSETSELEGNVGLDDDSDFPGPLPIVLALERMVNEREQRIVLSGDGDFLANAYLGNAGNQDFGVRLMEWLAREDNMLNIPSKIAADSSLSFEKWQIAVIGFGFFLVIPGALILNGVVIWKKRKNA